MVKGFIKYECWSIHSCYQTAELPLSSSRAASEASYISIHESSLINISWTTFGGRSWIEWTLQPFRNHNHYQIEPIVLSWQGLRALNLSYLLPSPGVNSLEKQGWPTERFGRSVKGKSLTVSSFLPKVKWSGEDQSIPSHPWVSSIPRIWKHQFSGKGMEKSVIRCIYSPRGNVLLLVLSPR